MSRSTEDRVQEINSRTFASRRKGFDPDEVRAYLGQVSELVSRLTAERDEARAQVSSLRIDAETRPAIDEDQLTEALGAETARVLTSARNAATDIRSRAADKAAQLLKEAADSAGQIRLDAESEVARQREEVAVSVAEVAAARTQVDEEIVAARAALEAGRQAQVEAATAEIETMRVAADVAADKARSVADQEAGQIRAEAAALLGEKTEEAKLAVAEIRASAEADAIAIADAARAEGLRIRSEAEDDKNAAQAHGKEMVAEAQRVRERMLADLSRRRKTARVQLEQLQAARDRLLEAYDTVQRTVDEATEGLRRSLPEAKTAAEAARLRAEAEPAPSIAQLEAQIEAARDAGLPLVAPLERDLADEAEFDGPEGEDEADQVSKPADPETKEVEAVMAEDAADDVVADGEVDEGSGAARPDAEIIDLRGATKASGAPGSASSEARRGEDEDEADDIDTEGSVDDLFARIKAAAPEVPEHEPPTDQNPVLRPGFVPDTPESEGPAETNSLPKVYESTIGRETDAESEAAEREPESDEDLDPMTALLRRRDGRLAPIENLVARKLRRVMADEQSLILDCVRRSKGTFDFDGMLTSADQAEAYAISVVDELMSAAEEGAMFESASLPSDFSPDEFCSQLGRDLMQAVRPRVERCFDGMVDAEDLSDRLRTTYREWKTERIIDATRHIVLAAFGEGQVAVHPRGAKLQWVADPTHAACPDCEDDALAGALESGKSFPTGHTHPPAHPGCRCMLVSELASAPA